MSKVNQIANSTLSYNSTDDKDILSLIRLIRNGIKYDSFQDIVGKIEFLTLDEWSMCLHISSRTMIRYKKDKQTFDVAQSERILQIALLNNLGIDVFGNSEKFTIWLETENLALGKIKPKELLDTELGIGMLKDELIRIEHGILA